MGQIQVQANVHLKAHPAHRAIITPFLPGFDVTRALTLQGEQAAAFFLKPSPIMADFLGIEREILLLYSPHTDFQMRTVTLHDKLLNDYRDRLDPLGSVIVSDSSDPKAFLDSLLGKAGDRAPIVALSRSQLAGIKDLAGLRTTFSAQFHRRDLFAYESPITREALFFDRTEAITALVDRFRSKQNSGLFGLRRIGKTSVLRAVQSRCESDGIGTVLYLDLSLPHRWMNSWRDLLRTIVNETMERIPRNAVDTSRVWAHKKLYSEELASSRFLQDMRYLCSTSPGRRILLALDEIENVSYQISPNSRWTVEGLPFWQTMRAVHQETDGALCYVLAGVNPQLLETQRFGQSDNPLFSTVGITYLQPFDYKSVRDMVRRLGKASGIAFDEKVYGELDRDFGGHPYLIRQACSRLVSKLPERPARITSVLYAESRAEICQALEGNVRQILSVLEMFYPQEHECVRRLAAGDLDRFGEAVKANPLLPKHVEGYGLVLDAASAHPTFRIGVVQEQLAKLPSPELRSEPVATDRTQVIAEVSRRRDLIERALRVCLADALYTAYGATKAASRVLGCLSDQRRERLLPFSYDEMWPEMYLSDLRQILGKEWVTFEPTMRPMEKERALQYIDHINESRADAHGKDLGEEDLTYLRMCFGRFETTLKRWIARL